MIEFMKPGDYQYSDMPTDPLTVPGEHFTFRNDTDGEIDCLFGFATIWHGYGRVYFSWIDETHSKKLSVTKELRRILLERSRLYHRIDTTVRKDFQTAIDYLEVLGFIREGLMESYDPVDLGAHYLYRYDPDLESN